MLDIGEISGQSLSLTALQHVCDHLPHLRNLSLSFDSSLPYNSAQGMRTPLSIVRSRTTRRHPLQRVCIHDSRSKMFKPKEYRDISMLFIQLFPDLDSLRVTLSEEEAWINEGWDLINDLWIDFQGLEDAIVER
ncbi:hypothetical protein BKA70DRAFT_1307947 [Coprinopsis sp. MPI-PUGE-AT-0042]|nr:hypothetical protein BKA70DRAFT_1307947 [Coprinopsis sp. MPI-PUGE-AT-0042]